MTKFLALLTFIAIIFASETTLAFNSIMLMDPAFLEFAFLNVPAIAIFSFAIIDVLYLSKILEQLFPKLEKRILFSWLLRANLFAIIFSEVLIVILIILLMGLFTDEETHPTIIMIGVAYFSLLPIYLAWDIKCKRIIKAVGKDKKDKNALSKSVKFHIAGVTVLGYAIMYAYLFEAIF